MGPYQCDKKHNDAALFNNEVANDQSFKNFLKLHGNNLTFYMDRGYS